MMATQQRVMVLTVTLDGKQNAMDAILAHTGIVRYTDAGWAIQAEGIILKARAATVPLIAPDLWPPKGEGVLK